MSKILGKRKRIDYSKAEPLTADVRPNSGGVNWPIEFLVEWVDGYKTWELSNNLLNVKEMLRSFEKEQAVKEIQQDLKRSKITTMRKRSRKALTKGSFEKNHRIREVVGVRRNKFDN